MNYATSKSKSLEETLLNYTNQIRVPSSTLSAGLSLYPFQREMIVNMLSSSSPHIYNACEQGMGKTPMAAVYANSINARNLLVICPASLRLNWLSELSTWYDTSPHFYTILGGDDVHKLLKHSFKEPTYYSPIITSYSMLLNQRFYKYLLSRTWDLIILDEYHYCKNINSKRTNKTLRLQHETTRQSLMLSGTPITNSALDIFPALLTITSTSNHVSNLFTNEEITTCSDYYEFANTFTYSRRNYRGGYDFVGVKNGPKLKALLRDPKKKIFFRRTKEEVLPDLPPKTYSRIDLPITLTKEIRSFLPAAEKFSDDFSSSLTEDETKEVLNKYFNRDKSLMHFRHLLGVAKASSPDLHQFIENLLEQGESVVVFAHHKRVVDLLHIRFKNYKPSIYTGSTKPNEKHEAVKRFQAGSTKLFIGNIMAAGVGITLTRSALGVMVEYDWLPANNEQAVDRLHRIGAKRPINIYYPITNTSFEKKLVNAMIRKHKEINEVMG